MAGVVDDRHRRRARPASPGRAPHGVAAAM